MDDTLDRILSLLSDRKITKGKFLKDLGFNKSAIAGWESGEHASYKKKLPEIADYFEVSLDWLTGKEQKNKPTAEAEGFSKEDIEFLSKIKHLSPDSKDFLVAQIDLLIARQEDQK